MPSGRGVSAKPWFYEFPYHTGRGYRVMVNFTDLTPLATTFGSVWLGVLVSIALGFVVGVVASLFGIGGGFVLTPYLHA